MSLLVKNLCEIVYVCFLFVVASEAARIDIINRCSSAVWAAASPGGGKRLNPGETWPLQVDSGINGRIWARTNCTFDGSGRGECQTGDCDGLLQCTSGGQPPNTLAEYTIGRVNNPDYFDISLVDGFNVPMVFGPTSNDCTTRSIRCTADVNGQCPNELKAPGGCNNPCTVFNTDQFCCRSGNCDTTYLAQYFKYRCPDAYSYAMDDRNSIFTCPGRTNYSVVFCASNTTSIVNYAQMHIRNNCSYTVWAAANPGGGRQLSHGETWTLNVTSPRIGRVWGRTNCDFDQNGRGRCDSGDCDGLLQCQGAGRAPHTLAEYSIGRQDDVNLFNISLVDGFNLPMEISPVTTSTSTATTSTSTSSPKQDCGRIICNADVNEPCPMELRDPGGCNNPCTIFSNDQFCCKSNICQPTSYSKFFKQLCPSALTYPLDNSTSVSCPTRITDYNVIFCP